MTYADRRGSNSSEVPQPGTVPLFLLSVSWGTGYVCRGRGVQGWAAYPLDQDRDGQEWQPGEPG